MNMREQMAKAMHDRFEADMHQASGGVTPMRPWERNKKTHALYLAQADAALDALLQLPEKACLPLGEWGVGEEGKRAAALLTWNGFISVIRLIQKGTA